MGTKTVGQTLPRSVKKVFRNWLKNENFDLDGKSLRGQTLDDAIGLILHRCNFNFFGEYQAKVNKKNPNFYGPIVEMVDEYGNVYMLALRNNGWPEVCIDRKEEKYNKQERFAFKPDFSLARRDLIVNDGVTIGVFQSPGSYTIDCNFGDGTTLTIDVASNFSMLDGFTIEEVMKFMQRTVNAKPDFLELCSQLASFSLFDSENKFIVSWDKKFAGFDPEENFSAFWDESFIDQSEKLVVNDGQLKELILTTDNRQIEYSGYNGTWTLKTGDNFEVSKKETDDKDGFEFSYCSDGLSSDDLKYSLSQKEEIEMCEQEVDEAVRSFQKVLVRNHKTTVPNDNYSGLAPCFVAGTLVMTDNGLKPIESIAENDFVLSYNVDTKNTELKKVKKTFIKQSDDIYQIFVNGEIIKATGGHVFYVNDEWISARDIKPGDKLMDSNKNIVEVDNVEIVQTGVTRVYNFEVEDNHNYFVGASNILVHNECELQW